MRDDADGNLESTKIYIYMHARIIISSTSFHFYLPHQLPLTHTHTLIFITQQTTDHHDAITAMCGGFSISWIWLRI